MARDYGFTPAQVGDLTFDQLFGIYFGPGAAAERADPTGRTQAHTRAGGRRVVRFQDQAAALAFADGIKRRRQQRRG